MWLEILVIVVIAILVIVPMLLRSELMHLLRTRSKLIWPAITAHRYYIIVSEVQLMEKEQNLL